jgi:hypothetical protein
MAVAYNGSGRDERRRMAKDRRLAMNAVLDGAETRLSASPSS